MNIYLDINGTLLNKDVTPANYLDDFIKNVVTNHSVYWLTTHCDGNAQNVLKYLNPAVSKETFEYLKIIKPTSWRQMKIEAIDIDTPFLWFDDYIFQKEQQMLADIGKLSSWIKVDLLNNPDFLKDFLNI